MTTDFRPPRTNQSDGALWWAVWSIVAVVLLITLTACAPKPVPVRSVGDGTWKVGTGENELPPGYWNTNGLGSGFICVWWVDTGDNTIQLRHSPANQRTSPATQIHLGDVKGEIFHSIDCGIWTHQDGTR